MATISETNSETTTAKDRPLTSRAARPRTKMIGRKTAQVVSVLAAMAPATATGAATLVALGGSAPIPAPGSPLDGGDEQASDDTADDGGAAPADGFPQPASASERKAVNDAVAYIRSLAELRGRNADWAERAVRAGESLSADAALAAGVIDLIASDRNELIRQLNGRVIDGNRLNLPPSTLITVIEPDWRTKFLSIITNPNVALLLVMVGLYGLMFEGYNPGAIVPGVVGAICLLLALYAFHVLPINYAGAALVGLGLALMLGEAFVPSFGVLGIGGVAAFVIGSVMLLDTDVPGYGISWLLIGSVALVSAGGFLLVMTLMLRARRRAVEGEGGLALRGQKVHRQPRAALDRRPERAVDTGPKNQTRVGVTQPVESARFDLQLDQERMPTPPMDI